MPYRPPLLETDPTPEADHGNANYDDKDHAGDDDDNGHNANYDDNDHAGDNGGHRPCPWGWQASVNM